MSKVEDLIHRILRKGYEISVDDGRALVVYRSRRPLQIQKSLQTEKDLLWIYDKTGFKFGWLQVNSETGEVLDWSRRDRRTANIIASEFVGE